MATVRIALAQRPHSETPRDAIGGVILRRPRVSTNELGTAVALALTLVACTDPTSPALDASADLGDGSPVDSSAPARFSVAATHGSLAGVDTRVAISGSGTSAIGAIDVSDGVGTLTLDASSSSPRPGAPAFVMTHELLVDDLFQTIVVSPDRLTVLWFYCSGGELQYVYFEDSRGGPMTIEPASGSCTWVPGPWPVSIDVPAFSFAAPPPPPGVHVVATDPALLEDDGGSPGHVTIGSRSLALYPFDVVDCSACGGGGWQELHVLLWDDASASLGFAILYLFPPASGRAMQMSYGLTLPTLERIADTTYEGAWSLMP